MKSKLIENLGKPMHLLIAFSVALLTFDGSYYLMKNLPGTRDDMCVMGAGLTLGNIVFSILLSILVGMMASGFVQLYQDQQKKKKRRALAVSSLTGLGMMIGSLTVFCTACTLSVISIFGFSFSLLLLTTYNGAFKFLSLIMMVVGLYQINKQLEDRCLVCVE